MTQQEALDAIGEGATEQQAAALIELETKILKDHGAESLADLGYTIDYFVPNAKIRAKKKERLAAEPKLDDLTNEELRDIWELANQKEKEINAAGFGWCTRTNFGRIQRIARAEMQRRKAWDDEDFED